jgi:iron complex outermembrane receptor protein
MQADRVSEGFESSYALDFLSQKLDFVVGLNLPLDLRADVRVSYQQREGDYSSPIAEDVQLYEPVTLVGLTVRRAFLSERLMAHIRIDNALDSEYNDYGNVLQPGRWWRMGFTFDLD